MLPRALTLALCLVASPAFAQPSVGVTSALDKVRPAHGVPPTATARIDAARNEFEAFQIVIGTADAVQATASSLVGPGGAIVDDIVLYRVGLYDVGTPSSLDGAPGPWPDPLIPAIDVYAGEARNAFPFDVPAGEVRSIWVEVFVRPGTPAGEYTGTVDIATSAGNASIPVTLNVRSFDLPSTSSLPSAFGMGWADACIAHRGSYAACGDAGVEAFHVLYARAALEHRISIESIVYAPPRDPAGWDHFADVYGGLLSGTGTTRLAGARLTTLRAWADTAAEMSMWRDELAARGWDATILFDYTCDEPPAGCAFGDIPSLAAAAREAGVPVLVTTDIDGATNNGLLDTIDVLTPVVNYMHDRGGTNRRAEYDAFLARPGTRLWWYQSCMSHGCGDGCPRTTDTYFTGWPSMMIDASGVQNRAMEWLSYRYDIGGELYFQTTHALPTAWTDQCAFSGNGDGTLFYPGRPDIIGGATDIPIESIRLKLIREGMEDYEYLRMLEALGDGALADSEAGALFPTPYSAGAASADALYAARARLADRIEELSGTPGEDAGPIGRDAGLDGGTGPGGGGCGCRATSGGSAAPLFVLVLFFVIRSRREP